MTTTEWCSECGEPHRGFPLSHETTLMRLVPADVALYERCPNSPPDMFDGNTDCEMCRGLGFVDVVVSDE